MLKKPAQPAQSVTFPNKIINLACAGIKEKPAQTGTKQHKNRHKKKKLTTQKRSASLGTQGRTKKNRDRKVKQISPAQSAVQRGMQRSV